MGRPRKDADTVEARQRIVDAFWALLAEHSLHDITVGMVAKQAQCTRGTFYYHYHDIDELISNAVDADFIGDSYIPQEILDLIYGRVPEGSRLDAIDTRLTHVSLLMDKGGMELTTEKIRVTIEHIWTNALYPDGQELSADTLMAIEYAVCGMMGIVSHQASIPEGSWSSEAFPNIGEFLRESATFLLGYIARQQGVSSEELLERLEVAAANAPEHPCAPTDATTAA